MILKTGEFLNDKYEVIDSIRGSMGIVYKLKDHKYDPSKNYPEYYAAKTLLPELAQLKLLKQRFENEAKLWLRIKPYRNIVKAYFVLIFHDSPYIFSDFIEPGYMPNNLAEWIYWRLTPPEIAINIMCQVIDGLWDVSFDNVTFHGDIKPKNILIDKRCIIRITDWGLARPSENDIMKFKKVSQSDVASLNSLIKFSNHGTPGYAAPEILKESTIPTRAIDTFSLGILFGEMLIRKIIPPDTSYSELKKILKSSLDLNSDFISNLSKIISDFIKANPIKRIRNYDENIKLLVELNNIIGLKVKPPRVNFYLENKQRTREISESLKILGDCDKEFKAFGF